MQHPPMAMPLNHSSVELITLLFKLIDVNTSCTLGPESPELADEQLKWIEKSLAASTADYIIVGGHYPVWSIGNHGPTSQLIEQLKPLLEKYNVNAYICGHDHNMQVSCTLNMFWRAILSLCPEGFSLLFNQQSILTSKY